MKNMKNNTTLNLELIKLIGEITEYMKTKRECHDEIILRIAKMLRKLD